jgi:Zn-finger nucleic acid-binding protein
VVFRDIRRMCPRCGGDFHEQRTSLGHRFERCSSCRGNWVDTLTLVEMFERLRPGEGMPIMLARHGDGDELRCPTCTRPMARRLLNMLHLDECSSHGVWFDGDELEQTLYRYVLSS